MSPPIPAPNAVAMKAASRIGFKPASDAASAPVTSVAVSKPASAAANPVSSAPPIATISTPAVSAAAAPTVSDAPKIADLAAPAIAGADLAIADWAASVPSKVNPPTAPPVVPSMVPFACVFISCGKTESTARLAAVAASILAYKGSAISTILAPPAPRSGANP